MSAIYESIAIVNSFHAVDADTKQAIQSDDKGYITPEHGTTIIFENPNEESSSKYVQVSTLIFYNGKTPTKLIINDNEKYPFYLNPGEIRGLDYMYVYKFKVIEGGSFYYEGMCSRM